MLEKNMMKLRYCNTKDQIVDIFTKYITKSMFLMLRDLIISPLTIKENYVTNKLCQDPKFDLN